MNENIICTEEVEAEVYEPGSGNDTFAQAERAVTTYSPYSPQQVVPRNEPMDRLPGMFGHLLGNQTTRQRKNVKSYGVYGAPLWASASTIHKMLAPHIGDRAAGVIGGALGGLLGGTISGKVMGDKE